jgi:cellulose synthase/poly-beta-1,6-N-acetylglucosamine synthase-like glycosyltransferase
MNIHGRSKVGTGTTVGSALPSGSDGMQRLSIVLPNYNYGAFIGEAVESALSVDWPDVEVIVVDDGSTDDSLDVLHGFGGRIRVITQENSGPRVACNRGFAESSGDVVIFLDSDDVLAPSIAREVAHVWRPGISKVQVQMRRIDREGSAAGRPFPAYRFTPTPQQIRHWMTTTAAYPTPPGSGNVYSREFLERLFPLDDRCGDATDSAAWLRRPSWAMSSPYRFRWSTTVYTAATAAGCAPTPGGSRSRSSGRTGATGSPGRWPGRPATRTTRAWSGRSCGAATSCRCASPNAACASAPYHCPPTGGGACCGIPS